MGTVEQISKWVIIFTLLLGLVILYEYASNQIKDRDEEIKALKISTIKDSIRIRQQIREQEEKLFLYEDSLRTLRINLIKAQNAKSRNTTSNAIKLLANSSTQHRDSLWTEEWARKDTFPY